MRVDKLILLKRRKACGWRKGDDEGELLMPFNVNLLEVCVPRLIAIA